MTKLLTSAGFTQLCKYKALMKLSNFLAAGFVLAIGDKIGSPQTGLVSLLSSTSDINEIMALQDKMAKLPQLTTAIHIIDTAFRGLGSFPVNASAHIMGKSRVELCDFENASKWRPNLTKLSELFDEPEIILKSSQSHAETFEQYKNHQVIFRHANEPFISGKLIGVYNDVFWILSEKHGFSTVKVEFDSGIVMEVDTESGE